LRTGGQQQAWQCRILLREGDVREEDPPDGIQRIGRLAGRAIDHAQQAGTYPVHDCDPDRLLGREMPEDRSLRDADEIGDGLRGDVVHALRDGQIDCGLDDLVLSLLGAQSRPARCSHMRYAPRMPVR